MSSTNVHLVAPLLALLTTVPYPTDQAGSDDLLENVKWLSYSFFSGVVKSIKEATYGKDEKADFLGASIFLLYTAVAVYFSFRVSVRLALASQRIPDAAYPAKASFFSCLSFLSFMVIGFYMFLFLTNSYLTWSNSPAHKLVGGSGFSTLAQRIWQWSTASSPLLDFARSLMTSNGGYWWSAQGLLSAMLSTAYMSAVSQADSISNELEFPLLVLLLPACFSQNLFFVALLLQKFHKSPAVVGPSRTRVLPEPAIWVVFVAFRALIAYLPVSSGRTWEFIACLLLSRLLLFAPFFVKFESPNTMREALPWALLYRIPLILASLMTASPDRLLSAATTNFAVSTFGVDFLMSLFSIGLFHLWDYVDDTTVRWARERQQKKAQKNQ